MLRTVRDRLRKFIAWLAMLNDTPHSIAMGAAVGVFISFTPTVGLHMALVFLLSLVIRMNRTAGLAAAWINNPLTVVPEFFFNYLVGTWVLFREPIGWAAFSREVRGALVYEHGYHRLWAMFTVLGRLTLEIAGPLWLGSVIVATTAAVPTYFVVRRLATKYHQAKPPAARDADEGRRPGPCGERTDGEAL